MDKKCYKCNEFKCIDEFHKDKTRFDGHESLCKSCKKIKDSKRKQYFKEWQIKKLESNPDYWKDREKTRDMSTRTNSNRAFRLRKYNLDEESYQQLMKNQEFKCAICKRDSLNSTEKEFAIDHDHNCCPEKGRSCGKCVRGLLCQVCNQALGMFQDSEEILLNAVQYLRNSQLNARSILGSEAGMMAAHFG